MSINRITLMGNVSSDVRATALEGGKKVVNFSLATNSKYKDKDGNTVDNAQFHKLVAFSPIADNIEKFVKKGSRLLVEGTVEYRKYTDKENVERNVTEIKVSSFTMLDKKEVVAE